MNFQRLLKILTELSNSAKIKSKGIFEIIGTLRVKLNT